MDLCQLNSYLIVIYWYITIYIYTHCNWGWNILELLFHSGSLWLWQNSYDPLHAEFSHFQTSHSQHSHFRMSQNCLVYPLANLQKTMEHRKFWWVNQLFQISMAIFNSKLLVYQRVLFFWDEHLWISATFIALDVNSRVPALSQAKPPSMSHYTTFFLGRIPNFVLLLSQLTSQIIPRIDCQFEDVIDPHWLMSI